MVTIVRLVFVGLVLAWVWMFPTDPFFHSGEGPDNGVRVIESHVFFAQAVIAVALILFIVFPIMPVFQSRWRRGKLRYWLLQPLLRANLGMLCGAIWPARGSRRGPLRPIGNG